MYVVVGLPLRSDLTDKSSSNFGWGNARYYMETLGINRLEKSIYEMKGVVRAD